MEQGDYAIGDFSTRRSIIPVSRLREESSIWISLVKAVALGHFLVLNHAFVDGNKRTTWEAMHTFIEENGYSLRAKRDEIIELMLQIEDKSRGVEQVSSWLKDHSG